MIVMLEREELEDFVRSRPATLDEIVHRPVARKRASEKMSPE